MRNSEYWQKRMMLLEEARHKDAKRALRSVLTSFGHARRKINSEIEKWLLQIAVNNELSMNEARKLLKADELDDFHMDLAEYIRKARDNDDDKWTKQLVNASAKVHISKWEAMNLAIEEYLREAFGDEDKIVNALLESTAREAYCQTAYEVENGLGMGKALNIPAVDAIVSNPWATDERIFSDRIWAHMREMKADLQDQLLQQTLTGAAPDDAIQTLEQYVKDKTESAGKRAATLVMTENAAISSAAQQKCYEDLGIDEYEIVATLDSKTCSRCGAKDLMHYPIKMYAPGSTANPFHARCRCTTAPYIEGDDVAERMMRNPETGKAEYIPNMTYEEWAKKYLTNTDSDDKINNNVGRFASDELLQWHYEKHRGEFENITAAEYADKARAMANTEASDDVVALLRSDGSTSKYRISTNEFVVINADGTIRTYFLPKDKGEYWDDEIKRNN